MKALSLHQPYASLIADGIKTLESRKWHANFSGDILICATKKYQLYPSTERILKEINPLWSPRNEQEMRYGCAICIAEVTNCRKFKKDDDVNVLCAWFNGYVFELTNIRPVTPFPVIGRQRFFEVPDEIIIQNLITCAE